MAARYRIAGITLQPLLVLDDGEELAPGPPIEPTAVSMADLVGCAAYTRLRIDLAAMNDSLAEAPSVEVGDDPETSS